MFPHERQQAVADLARRHGRVEVVSLAEQLGVTPETVRRDLSELERLGVVRRVHGGAVPVERFSGDRAVGERGVSQQAEKARIARAALAEVPDDGTIILDAGTTTGALAELLPDRRTITVVTNDLRIAQRLAGRQGCTVFTVGGRVRPATLSQVDAWAARALLDIVADVAFLGANGFSVARGVTTPDLSEAAVKRAMVAAGRRCVLLADHTKAGHDSFGRFASLADFDLLVTDTGLEDETAAEIELAGPGVVRA
ncbi:MAG: DeoR/GlpR family DNA-binding transcription regulator [Actinomycetota bacterium]|nr:DeoR/GlpR family DNA-binding transcription regulator [Actinomycetota bacterium]